MTRRVLASSVALLVVCCFGAPSYEGRLCDSARQCPTGYTCGADSTCRSDGSLSPSPDASVSDAGTVPRDGGVEIPCTETSTRACYDGPANTLGVGICTAGEQTCEGGDWQPCVGSFEPRAETCDGADEDCDGAVDNGSNGCGGVCALSVPVSTPCDLEDALDVDTCPDDLYACDGLNNVVCVNAGTDGDTDGYSVGPLMCGGDCADGNADINPGATEICNAEDDNCDGATDEGCDYDMTACQGTPPAIADTTMSAPIPSCNTQYFVSPTGNDSNNGLSAAAPFLNINQGLSMAAPGDCVTLAPGEYLQDVVTVRNGTATAPILLSGPRSAVIRGAGQFSVVFILHDYIYLEGFTINGLFGDPTDTNGYRDKLIRIHSNQPNIGVRGAVLRGLLLRNARRGCVRIRYLSSDNEIVANDIQSCARHFELTGLQDTEGDGVFLGTFRPLINQNPTPVLDNCARNWIHDNVFRDVSQCVEVQGDSIGNVVERNDCERAGNTPSAGSYEIGGNWNVFRNNTALNGMGHGLRFKRVDTVHAICNTVVNNTLENQAQRGFSMEAAPQLQVCGNTATGNGGGVSGGRYSPLYDVTATCP